MKVSSGKPAGVLWNSSESTHQKERTNPEKKTIQGVEANFPQVLCAIDDLNVSLNMSEQDQRDYKNKKRQKAEGEIAELWEEQNQRPIQ